MRTAMQNGRTCLRHVNSVSQNILYGVETTIESSKEQFQKVFLRLDIGFLGLQKQTLGPSKKVVGQKNALLSQRHLLISGRFHFRIIFCV